MRSASRSSLTVFLAVLVPSAAYSQQVAKKPHEPLLLARRAPLRAGQPVLLAADPVATSAAVFGAANALGLGISAVTGWHYHLDLIGTGVFAVAAYATRGVTLAQGCSAAAVALWAGKLASFLFYRALLTKHDARLTDTLATTSGQAGFWVVSFLWGWVVSLPHTLAAAVPVAERPEFGAMHVVGLALFALGLTIESGADLQKWLFKADPANKGLFCDVGVWKLCQHPNWFGNLVLWCGIYVLNVPTLASIGPAMALGPLTVPAWLGAASRLATAAISPLFLFALFSAQAFGVPKGSGFSKGFDLTMAKFGQDPAWQAYSARTPPFIPSVASVMATLRGS